jgi:pimeloyl-ACP methyl ester carboxylesterase
MKTTYLTQKLTILIALGVMTLNVHAQCDDYDFEHKLDKPTTEVVDEEVVTPPQNATEFAGCTSENYDRAIFYLHGLGGSVASWSKQQKWTFQNYKVRASNIDYSAEGDQDNFYTATDAINLEIQDFLDAEYKKEQANRCNRDDFVIAHSQGGIAARYLDMLWDQGYRGDRKFYGLVTFGTPHAGADISLTQDDHNDLITEVIDAVYLKDGYNLLSLTPGLKDKKDDILKLIKDKISPVILKELHTGTLDEMAPNTKFMDELNKHQSALRKVAFYGIEVDPLVWRILDNMVNTAAEDHPIFAAKKDDEFMNEIENVRADHLGQIENDKKNIRRGKAAIVVGALLGIGSAGTGTLIFAGGGIALIKKSRRSIEMRTEAVTFLNNANTQWKHLIGAIKMVPKPPTNYFLAVVRTNMVMAPVFSKKFDTRAEADKWVWDITKAFGASAISSTSITLKTSKNEMVLKEFPSDGVVLTNSQKAFPGVKNRIDKMPGDNHFQERNSANTELMLKNLLKGQYDDYFSTPPKI